MRTRANLYGRTGSGNRCGHDRRKFVKAKYKQTLPLFILKVRRRFEALALPLTLDFYCLRSERNEAMKAVGSVQICATDILTGRIGRPDRKVRGRFNGLSVDYDLAPSSEISESRTERVLSTFKDLGWQHWHAVEPGHRRKPKRGIYRCASQPIEEKANGERRGRPAIRQWTDGFFKALGAEIYAELMFLRKKISDANAAREKYMESAGATQVPVRPLVVALAESICVPGTQRGPPE